MNGVGRLVLHYPSITSVISGCMRLPFIERKAIGKSKSDAASCICNITPGDRESPNGFEYFQMHRAWMCFSGFVIFLSAGWWSKYVLNATCTVFSGCKHECDVFVWRSHQNVHRSDFHRTSATKLAIADGNCVHLCGYVRFRCSSLLVFVFVFFEFTLAAVKHYPEHKCWLSAQQHSLSSSLTFRNNNRPGEKMACYVMPYLFR